MNLSPDDVFALIQSPDQFPVDFDIAWQWIGYSSKQMAKEALQAHSVEGIDFSILGLKSSTGGRRAELIGMTIDGFKMFCMMAGTQKGREVRLYFLNCEAQLKQKIADERSQSKQTMQQQLVGAMVDEDVVSRQPKFPEQYYKTLYRLYGRGWEIRDPKKFRPSCVGTWTNQTVYDLMLGGTAPGGVKSTLNKVNPRRENGTRKNKHHNHLKELGQFHLEIHLHALMAVANTIPDGRWDLFMQSIKLAFPNDEPLQLTLWNIFEQMQIGLSSDLSVST